VSRDIPIPPLTYRDIEVELPSGHWNAEVFAGTMTEALAARYPEADTIKVELRSGRTLGFVVMKQVANRPKKET